MTEAEANKVAIQAALRIGGWTEMVTFRRDGEYYVYVNGVQYNADGTEVKNPIKAAKSHGPARRKQ